MELLVISHTAPFDKARMAGEKTHNYYLKKFAKQLDVEVRIITICKETDYEKLDFDKYGIKSYVLVEKQGKCHILLRKLKRMINLIVNPNDKYANFVSGERLQFYYKTLCDLKKSNYMPACIILEFTHSILLINMVKEIFPDSKIVASSHDVNFIGSYRRWQYEKNIVTKYFRKRQYMNLRNREVDALSKCDLIVTQNDNDIAIFKRERKLNNKNFLRIVPYYDLYKDIERNSDGKTILFYGAMGRAENYLSVQWFIENVFYKLNDDFHFVIVGGNPPECIQKYDNDRIHVTGFLEIDELKSYFSTCMCMVVPLQLGSGIKVKVLEAFSGAVPVITNDIGNEGIYARNGKEIICCNLAEEFVRVFNGLKDNIEALKRIGEDGRAYGERNFDLNESFALYLNRIKELDL